MSVEADSFIVRYAEDVTLSLSCIAHLRVYAEAVDLLIFRIQDCSGSLTDGLDPTRHSEVRSFSCRAGTMDERGQTEIVEEGLSASGQ